MREGDCLRGRFLIERQAGAGAMGLVFRARDVSDGKAVAVKALRTFGGDSLARFSREAGVLARLCAPEIARYVAHGSTDAGELFLVMEWIVGESLDERLKRGQLTFGEIVHVATFVARALIVAHEHGIIHRDLKPANIMLASVPPAHDGSSYPTVKVVDFGVARVRGDGETLTGTGEMIGTLAYMSPEQARGAKNLDGRSDLFALGAIIFRALTGAAPFESGDSLETLLRLAHEHAPRIATRVPATPPRLAKLVDALLETDPGARPTDARSVLRELELTQAELAGFAQVLPVSLALPPTVVDRTANRTKRRSWPLVVGGLLLTTLGAALALLIPALVSRAPRARSSGDAPAAQVATSAAKGTANPNPTAPAARPPAKRTLDGWIDYRDPRGAFEVKLECAPRYKPIPRYVDSGATFERSVASCDSKRGFVAVSVSDVLTGATMSCELANRMSEEYVMHSLGCTSVARQAIKTGPFDGTQVLVNCPERRMQGQIRYLCDPSLVASGRGRGFVVQLLRFVDEWDEPEAALFWQTFRPKSLP